MNDFFDRVFKSIITGALGALFVTFIFLLISKPSTDDPLFYLSCYLGIIFGFLFAWLSYRGSYISDFEQLFEWYPNGVICWELESRIIKSVENDYLDIGYSNKKKAVKLKKHIIDKNKEIIHAFELLKEKYPRGIKNTEAKFYGKYKIYILHHESEIEKAEEEERRREKIESLKNRFRNIEIIYPRGVKHWLEINNASKPLNDTQLQKISEEESLVRSYEEKSCKEEEIEIWKKEQQVFSKQCRKLRDEQLFGFGCYVYNIDINKYGVSTPERFPVWQMFAHSYCKEEDLDYTNYQSIKNNKHSVESKIVVLSDKHSEKIVSFVDKLNNEEKTAIYFNPINYRNWSSNVYLTTYNIILAKLSNRYRDIIYDPTEEVLMGRRPNFEEWKSNIERRVVVIDIATENDDLKTVCNKLINELAPIKPLITYISIQKCYDINEMLDIIEKDKKKREEEEKERQRKLKEEEEKNRLRKLKEEEEKERQRKLKEEEEKNRLRKLKEEEEKELSNSISPCFKPQTLPYVKMTEQFSMHPITENSIEEDANTLSVMLMFDKDTKKYMSGFSGPSNKEKIASYLFNSFVTQSMGISFTYIIRLNAGICGLIKVTSPTHNKVTNNFEHWLIDYILIPPLRGHKIMKSALPIVFDIMKNRLGISEPVYAMVLPDNYVSIHLLSLNGFIKETSVSLPLDPSTGKEAFLYKKIL